MKKIFLFSTKLWVYLTEIAPIILLTVSIIYNDEVKTVMKLYPLITVLSALIIFIAVYFFRGVSLSFDELKCIGWFSSRDKATVKKDRAVVISVLKRRRIRIELFGRSDDGESAYSWQKGEDVGEINLFRAKANGNLKTVKKLLKYFGVPISDTEQIISDEAFSKNYGDVTVSSETVNEEKRFRIYFNETM